MSKYKEHALVCSQEQIGTDIWSLWIQTGNIAREAGPASFCPFIPETGPNYCRVPSVSVRSTGKETGSAWYTG